MKVTVHIGPEFEKRREICYDLIVEFLRKELENEGNLCSRLDRGTEREGVQRQESD
ncbi:hypothetical protein SD77_2069 [Bacillus badius]|uniref:Uncharacterized protein n=1 Tax=Bacillus badius TaxID=1455 RepID=A0ABR5AXZ8_BACBA|nr:hypothetical protein SD77_2069 [Bacillus badius]